MTQSADSGRTNSDPVTTREWDAYHQGVIDGLSEAVDLVPPENMESLMTSIGAHRDYFIHQEDTAPVRGTDDTP